MLTASEQASSSITMSSPLQAARNVLCLGDPDAFASEMIKMINDKEFR